MENGSVKGRADHPLHSGIAGVSLGGCELSAQSPTEEGDLRLNGPWSRAWSTGSVREAEVKLCGAGAGTSPRTQAGSPERRRRSSPRVVGVGVGWETPAVLLSALTLLRLLPGGGSEMVFIIVNYT